MLAHVAHAHGAPSSTMVLPAERFPTDEEGLAEALADGVAWLARHNLSEITKIALISVSDHPLFDLDYRFVQVIPGSPVRFDFRGSCGHSVLASAVVAGRLGWISRLAPEQRIRVRVLNNGDHVVCEVDESVRSGIKFTAHFLNHPEVPLSELLPFGEPTSDLPYDGGMIRASAVSVGNPYVFLSGYDLGITTSRQLFAAGRSLFGTLTAIRRSAARQYGYSPEGAFPKVAVVLPDSDNCLAVRAVSVPSWHPTLALTGAVCLAAARHVRGTIPFGLAGADEPDVRTPLTIRTAGGVVTATAEVSGYDPDSKLFWVSVPEKSVTFTGALAIDSFDAHVLKEDSCLLSS
nr:PrpF domain-containing protein [Kibdelosporangium sp. MJ126-NF4]CEL16437.1 Uncharacterized protein Bsu YraM [Kibdelosporangium sp. MJ126-NF4]CTQ90389.1 Uncharacterized protein Bsu YraM [Kibdelosporangium sp. MJ126-NF4]